MLTEIKRETQQMIQNMMRDNPEQLNKRMIGAFGKLNRLKQMCLHPSLLKRSINRENWETFTNSLATFLINNSTEFKKRRCEEIRATMVDGVCPICFENLEGIAQLAFCGHVFCNDCIQRVMGPQGNKKCPECMTSWNRNDLACRFKDIPNDLFDEEQNDGFQVSAKLKMISNLVKHFIENKPNSIDCKNPKFRLVGDLPIEHITDKETDDCKIIIFSQ